MSVRTLPGGALVVWPETLSRTPWLINKSAVGPQKKKKTDVSHSVRCSFAGLSVQAFVESRNRMTCLVPPAAGANSHYTTVQISMNRQEYSQTAASYFYFQVMKSARANYLYLTICSPGYFDDSFRWSNFRRYISAGFSSSSSWF